MSGHEALERGAPSALHEQLGAELERLVRAASPGDRLPTELELTRRYGVSRTTIRRAMQVLIDRDVVVRRPGMGTFVKVPTLTHELSGSATFLADVFTTGASHEIRLLDFEWGRRPVPDDTVVDGEGWLSANRLYLRDGTPLAYAQLVVPEPAGSQVTRQDMEESVPLAVLHRVGVQVVNVHVVITYLSADVETARLLDLAPGAPCVQVTRRLDSERGRPCLWSWTRLPADRMRFSFDMAATGPGAGLSSASVHAEALPDKRRDGMP